MIAPTNILIGVNILEDAIIEKYLQHIYDHPEVITFNLPEGKVLTETCYIQLDSRIDFSTIYWTLNTFLKQTQATCTIGIRDKHTECFFRYHEGIYHDVTYPSIINLKYGEFTWYADGKLHRYDGPAMISIEGIESEYTFYVHGIQHTPDRYLKLAKEYVDAGTISAASFYELLLKYA